MTALLTVSRVRQMASSNATEPHPSRVRRREARSPLDVGHGSGSFRWEVAEVALRQGFLPTTISTDLHTESVNGPTDDLPTTMSKFLALGVPLQRVVEMASSAPARVLGREGELGTLAPGAIADIAIFETLEGSFPFTDSYGGIRIGEVLLKPIMTVRGGEVSAGAIIPGSKASQVGSSDSACCLSSRYIRRHRRTSSGSVVATPLASAFFAVAINEDELVIKCNDPRTYLAQETAVRYR